MSDISPAVPREGYPARRVDANDPPFRVWIVDPLPTSREGLRRIIDGQSQLRVAGTSSDASDLIATSDTPSLDVVLITDKVPVNKAFITIQKIRQTKPELPIVRLANGTDAALNDPGLKITATIDATASVNLLLATLVTAAQLHGVGSREALSQQRRSAIRRPLSAREHQVLELLANGTSNRGVAQLLSIGDETVKTHVAHILSKLEARDRTHAVAIALRNGIIR